MSGAASAGTLLQLAAVGLQNEYLNANPTITFWRSVYRRYTNFAQEHVSLSFINSRFSASLIGQVQKNGDLISKGYFTFVLPAIEPDRCGGSTGVYWTNAIGQAIIVETQLVIGGQPIDKQVGLWMHIWTELTNDMDCKYLGEMIGRRKTVKQLQQDALCPQRYYTPLLFAPFLSYGNALPVIALQYHTIYINVQTARLSDLWISLGNANATPLQAGTVSAVTDTNLDASLLLEYVYLDCEERVDLAQTNQEYLIQQVQFTSAYQTPMSTGNCSMKVDLVFNTCLRGIQWVFISDQAQCAKNWFDFSGPNGEDPVAGVQLMLNGSNRFAPTEGRFFRLVVPYEHWTNIPEKHIYSYMFDLNSQRQDQPSGALNAARLDSVVLILTMAAGAVGCVQVFAPNWNVFRVMAGLGGLAFASN